MRHGINSSDLTQPVGPFSHAVRSQAGEVVYISGQAGQDPRTGALVAGGTAAQAEQVLRNIEAALAAAGMTSDDVLKANVYLVDIADFREVNEVYARHFTPPFPARTTVVVAGLPLGARVELDVVACRQVSR